MIISGHIELRDNGKKREGILHTKEGDIPLEYEFIPYTKEKLHLVGSYANGKFRVELFYIDAELSRALPREFVEKHRVRIKNLEKKLGDKGLEKLLKEPVKYGKLIPNKKFRDEILLNISEHYVLPNLQNYFSRFSLTPKKIYDIYGTFKSRSLEIIDTYPYELTKIKGIPFYVPDTIAKEKGIDPSSASRIEGALQHVYTSYKNSGNSYITENEMINRVFILLNGQIAKERIKDRLKIFSERPENEVIKTSKGSIYYRPLFFAERQIAERLNVLKETKGKIPRSLDRVIETIEKNGDIHPLGDNIKEGIKKMFESPIFLITGEAGTGKTSLIASIIKIIERTHPKIKYKLASLTAKAARRLEQTTEKKAYTIHMLLGKGIDEKSHILYHHKTNPLPADLVIIDEATMVNEFLFRDILWAIEDGTKLIFVGDPNQLEPIGPGKPFLDLIELGFPRLHLTENHRSRDDVIRFAKAILNEDIEDEIHLPSIRFIQVNNIEEIKKKVLQIHIEKGYPIISVYREETELGTEKLNSYLKKHINPTDTFFGMGDPIMQIENNKEKDVYNGEVGKVIGVNPLQIKFETGKVVTYKIDEMFGQLDLAYALTVAKTQGSEYEGVIIPLFPIGKEIKGRRSMWYKNSIYTAVTRSKKEIIFVGDINELKEGIERSSPPRQTNLKKMLESVFELEVN